MRIFFKNAFTVSRLAETEEDENQETYEALGAVKGLVTSIAPSDAFLSEGNLSQSSTLICDYGVGLIVSDKLARDGKTYIVRGVKLTETLFGIKYQRAVIEEMNS